MRRGTFLTRENRNGRPWQAYGYICEHEVRMSECSSCPSGREVENAMVTWWNNSFVQMQDRITVRDRILQGA